jgi:Rod binding domain-containing protein
VSIGALLSAPVATTPDPALPSVPAGKDPKEAAKQFEGLLMANLFQELRKTVHTSGLFGDGGNARSTYEYLLDQAVVNHAMDSGKTWGLSDKLEASIRAAQKKMTGK